MDFITWERWWSKEDMDKSQKVILTCMCQICNGDEICEYISECFYNKVTQKDIIK